MKFALNRTKKDCVIPTSALAVAGLKKEKDLRLEVESDVIVVLRRDMNAKKLFSVSEFLHNLASDMIVAVALECGEYVDCGECFDEECECCECLEHCSGISIPDCLLEQAGIAGQGLKADVENGAVVIRALNCDDDADKLHEGVPEAARFAFLENNVCIPRLRELLCNGKPLLMSRRRNQSHRMSPSNPTAARRKTSCRFCRKAWTTPKTALQVSFYWTKPQSAPRWKAPQDTATP